MKKTVFIFVMSLIGLFISCTRPVTPQRSVTQSTMIITLNLKPGSALVGKVPDKIDKDGNVLTEKDSTYYFKVVGAVYDGQDFFDAITSFKIGKTKPTDGVYVSEALIRNDSIFQKMLRPYDEVSEDDDLMNYKKENMVLIITIPRTLTEGDIARIVGEICPDKKNYLCEDRIRQEIGCCVSLAHNWLPYPVKISDIFDSRSKEKERQKMESQTTDSASASGTGKKIVYYQSLEEKNKE